MPVVIIGGGPAGAATAIALCNIRISCIIVEQSETPVFKPGESLPPTAHIPLQRLGLSHLLQEQQHTTCVGNMTSWGNDKIQTRHFFTEPHGNGWNIDRSFFEHQLLISAQERGTLLYYGYRSSGILRRGDDIYVNCINTKGENLEIKTSFIVDATGRSACIARTAGVRRYTIDRLTGYYALVDHTSDAFANMNFIEAVSDGWWYASATKEGKHILNFMTDPDIHSIHPHTVQTWLFEKFIQTTHLKNNFHFNTPAQLTKVLVKPASTSCLEKITGDSWLAVGDAACTYDPLSSFGITAALGSSLYAALAIKDYLTGNETSMKAYCHVQQQSFNNYMTMLQHQYSLEQRWKNSTFWQRRHLFNEYI